MPRRRACTSHRPRPRCLHRMGGGHTQVAAEFDAYLQVGLGAVPGLLQSIVVEQPGAAQGRLRLRQGGLGAGLVSDGLASAFFCTPSSTSSSMAARAMPMQTAPMPRARNAERRHGGVGGVVHGQIAHRPLRHEHVLDLVSRLLCRRGRACQVSRNQPHQPAGSSCDCRLARLVQHRLAVFDSMQPPSTQSAFWLPEPHCQRFDTRKPPSTFRRGPWGQTRRSPAHRVVRRLPRRRLWEYWRARCPGRADKGYPGAGGISLARVSNTSLLTAGGASSRQRRPAPPGGRCRLRPSAAILPREYGGPARSRPPSRSARGSVSPPG